ncbi:hypothetical protein [uncultured Cohaesibacter sp.]|uniref:GltB/FmdC/FwdC-like GXGXG domain-containing protein n=1 Tax=uncultured Cohaesibacter sp. TaxID=1002546 RepID=UPI0029318804|nr:hypothetical protein [uncultured Cohaesibacter sp.]
MSKGAQATGFGVRNSGATAVVEGVGDFCCEYMTNGAVMNLGGFGKGFCNGMSGGVAYQYDPYDQLENLHSHDSVKLHRLDGDNDRAKIHRLAVERLLRYHIKFTNSAKARFLLEHFDTEIANFKFATPLALETYQNYEAILKSQSSQGIDRGNWRTRLFPSRSESSSWPIGMARPSPGEPFPQTGSDRYKPDVRADQPISR